MISREESFSLLFVSLSLSLDLPLSCTAVLCDTPRRWGAAVCDTPWSALRLLLRLVRIWVCCITAGFRFPLPLSLLLALFLALLLFLGLSLAHSLSLSLYLVSALRQSSIVVPAAVAVPVVIVAVVAPVVAAVVVVVVLLLADVVAAAASAAHGWGVAGVYDLQMWQGWIKFRLTENDEGHIDMLLLLVKGERDGELRVSSIRRTDEEDGWREGKVRPVLA